MEWAFFALLANLTYVAALETNGTYRADGTQVNAWRALITTIAFVPLLPFMEWPDAPGYYAVMLASAVASIIGMNSQFNLAARFNGRVANLHTPFCVLVTFIGWLAVDADERAYLLAHPDRLGLIVGAIMLLGVSFMLIRKNPVGWSALMAIIPVGAVFGLCNVMDKLLLDAGTTGMPIVLNLIFLQNLVMTLWFAPALRRGLNGHRSGAAALPAPLLKSAAHIAVFHTASWIFISLAFLHTHNPVYPVIVTSLSPLWFMIYYRLRRIEDNASPFAGALMFAAGVLILLSNSGALAGVN